MNLDPLIELLDELEGIQASYEIAGADEARRLDEERVACRDKIVVFVLLAIMRATKRALDALYLACGVILVLTTIIVYLCWNWPK